VKLIRTAVDHQTKSQVWKQTINLVENRAYSQAMRQTRYLILDMSTGQVIARVKYEVSIHNETD